LTITTAPTAAAAARALARRAQDIRTAAKQPREFALVRRQDRRAPLVGDPLGQAAGVACETRQRVGVEHDGARRRARLG